MITLQNQYLTARFSPETGSLAHLATSRARCSLVRPVHCTCYEQDGAKWYSDPAERDGAEPFALIGTAATADSFEAVLRHPDVEVRLRYELPPNSPLLRVTGEVRGLCDGAELHMAGSPHVPFGEGMLNAFEDDEALFFDGAELPGGRELPCWRVFARGDRRSGLIIATRTKLAMSRMEILGDSFDLRPHQIWNYCTGTIPRPPLRVTRDLHLVAEFEMGPWTRDAHDAILRAARLDKPVDAGNQPPAGKPARVPQGHVFRAVEFAPARAASRTFGMHKWLVADMPWAQGGQGLFAGPGVRPPALVLNPKLHGVYRVFVGVGNGAGVKLTFSGDREATYRLVHETYDARQPVAAFRLHLSGRHTAHEVDCGVVRMDGRSVRVERFPNRLYPCVLDYVRFQELTPAQVRRFEKEEASEPCLPLSGHNDIPDIAHQLDVSNPDPDTFRANIWEHARCKVRKIYWRIDGQCSDYPSRVNTMRYPFARVHGVFEPQSPAYGKVLKQTDILKLAVAAAREYGVELWGWMRFNSYMGNVQSEFYTNNARYWEEWEYGGKGKKLCLAHPAVRKHKIDILVEAAGYGLQGLNLGFLRHPPVLLYAEILRKGYEKKYGVAPPRDFKHPDAHYRFRHPPTDAEHVRWFQYRADFLTQFGRELRAALKKKGLGHVKIAIWVRPNHCLFDGIDIPAWLDEGLCDEVISDFYCSLADADLHWETPEWKAMVQAKVPLIRGVLPDAKHTRSILPRILRDGYDGICTYESNQTCLENEFIDIYRKLRQ